MTVGELKELLAQFDDGDVVVLSKDAEGNDYSPLSNWSLRTYVPETTWYGYVRLRELTPDLAKAGFTEEEVEPPNGEDALPALVLWPVN